MATARDYNRIMHKAWDGVSTQQVFNVWPRHAASYCRAMYKKATGRKLNLPIRYGTGNRLTWARDGVLTINPSSGWKEINHDFTHWIERRTTGDAHSDHHLQLERDGAQMIRRRFLTDGPEPKVEKPKRDLVAERAKRVDANIERWEKKLKRAETALKKLRKKKRYYDKALAERA